MEFRINCRNKFKCKWTHGIYTDQWNMEWRQMVKYYNYNKINKNVIHKNMTILLLSAF